MWRRATGTPMLAATSRWESDTATSRWESDTQEVYSTRVPLPDRRGVPADGFERARTVRPSAQRVVERRPGAKQGSTHPRALTDTVGRQSADRRDQSRAERVAIDHRLAQSRNLAGAPRSQWDRHRRQIGEHR